MPNSNRYELTITSILITLRSLSLLWYFVLPIFSWIPALHWLEPYDSVELILAFIIVLVMHIYLLLSISNRNIDCINAICKKLLWTATPGVIPAIFVICYALGVISIKVQTFGFIMLLFSTILSFYLVLISPGQTQIVMELLQIRYSYSKYKALAASSSLTILPFLGVALFEVIVSFIRR